MTTASVKVDEATTANDVEAARTLFTEYERAIGVSLCFQGFAEELAGLPGAYTQGRGGGLWIARDAATTALLGCVALRTLAEGIGEMKRLYVRDAARGRGLGHRLAATVIARAHAAGHHTLRLDTLASMHGAIAIYRALGFVEIAPYRDNPLGDAMYFELALDTPLLFHLVASEAWSAARERGVYAPESLTREGFIHFSEERQVARTAARFFAGRNDMLVVAVPRADVLSALRYEVADGDAFPHVYRALPTVPPYDAVPLDAWLARRSSR